MLPLTLHHYGLLTADTAAWLIENEFIFGKPYHVSETTSIASQKVAVTFVQQTKDAVFIELVQPAADNLSLHKMIAKGVTVYHMGYTVPAGAFDETLKTLENKGAHSLPVFHSEAYNQKRCVFVISKNTGMIELIEQ